MWGETPYTKDAAINWIERAGRNCYRSEDKIVDGSGKKFVENIIKRKHYSVLEHSNIVIRTKEKKKFPYSSLLAEKSVYDSKYFSHMCYRDHVYISGNWRAWFEWYNSIAPEYADMMCLDNIYDILSNDAYEVVTNPSDIPNELKHITVELITDRAVTHELVRHRPASYSQESQRYVRYDNIDFIRPSWFDKHNEDSIKREIFMDSCEYSEQVYRELISLHSMKAEDARVILPNATATRIIMTASVPEWNHIFNLRLSKEAYRQIRKLLIGVKDDFVEKGLV